MFFLKKGEDVEIFFGQSLRFCYPTSIYNSFKGCIFGFHKMKSKTIVHCTIKME